MVYLDKDGTIRDTQPWSVTRIWEMFYGLIMFFVLFFKSLIQPNATKLGDRYQSDYRSRFRGNGGGGGGGGGGGPFGPGPGDGPQRRIGRIGGVGGPSPPPVSGGCCGGGGCG